MTSKDIVERIRQFANPYGNGYPYNQYTDSYGKLCEELNAIEKDLELLAIYEKVISIKDIGGTKVAGGIISDEDYEKIRKLRKV